jgi:hypothetical protein
MSEEDMDSEEEDTPVVGGEGFTPEELAQAEQNFTTQLVRILSLPACAICQLQLKLHLYGNHTQLHILLSLQVAKV